MIGVIQNFNFNFIKPLKVQSGLNGIEPSMENSLIAPNILHYSHHISFLGSSTYNFKIKNIPNMRCPVCENLMLSDKQVKQFANDIADKRGEELVRTLEKYEDDSIFTGKSDDNKKHSIFRPQRQAIIDIIKKLALKYPECDLKELTEIEAQHRLSPLIDMQLDIVSELKDYVQNCAATESEKRYIMETIDTHTKRIIGEGSVDFERRPFIYALEKSVSDKEIQEEITRIISQLPNSNNDIDAFFIKYAKTNINSRELGKVLLQPSIPSADHIVPHDIKIGEGQNSPDNYLCLCAHCNSQKSNTPFYVWQKTIPNLEKNLYEYLRNIRRALDDGIIKSDYESYIPNFVKTIYDASFGEIALDISQIKPDEKRAQTIQKRKASMQVFSRQTRVMEQERKELNKRIQIMEYLKKNPDAKTPAPQIISQKEQKFYELQRLLIRAKSMLTDIKDEEERTVIKEAISSFGLKLSELEKELESARIKQRQYENMQNMENLPELKAQSQVLKAQIQIRKDAIERLQNYRQMSDEEFESLIGLAS